MPDEESPLRKAGKILGWFVVVGAASWAYWQVVLKARGELGEEMGE